MTSTDIRRIFFDFFKEKQHDIQASAPMVIKNDPTLMFTNAGMNQFKDIFLGNKSPKEVRVANTQKCLRVSGKHNDLEEVGKDTYHHTMFEMLGNWSFGDYFKKEAIQWAWELMTEVYKIDKERLYVTYFEGNPKDKLEYDNEAYSFWKEVIPEKRILPGSKKDNFWEMGETGPCGPCSEIHIDLRSDEERTKTDAVSLVNKDHPLVIEIWNLVFVEYNRKSDGKLEALKNKHIDTGMGFERLCMVIQGKKSNYDTDVFMPLINKLCDFSGIKYGKNEKTDIAIRVIADHVRAITFAIADGQLPSNVKAGYVIRRILRRAVRYAYTFLNIKEPIINNLVPILVEQLGEIFPEIEKQKELIQKVITEEEIAFLNTLETGIKLLDKIIEKTKKDNYKVVEGKIAFELYDTYGFPLDLTELILSEQNLVVNRKEFDAEMQKQKDRSRNAAAVETDDWIVLRIDDIEEFVGYDYDETEVFITRYRRINTKGKELYQLVFNITPFYAEGGGQVGDTGYIESDDEKIFIFNTKSENNLTIHFAKTLPKSPEKTFKAVVNAKNRNLTASNHTTTHLLHESLTEILGNHVEQKGSLVNPDYLRFDFSHFQKLSNEEIEAVEKMVNKKIRADYILKESRAIPMPEAKKLGATALFGEKYGDLVRVIELGSSIELCGGIHLKSTAQAGVFKITSESAVAAGIRRIEAITSLKSEEYFREQTETIKSLKELVKSPKDIVKCVKDLITEKESLEKQLTEYKLEKIKSIHNELTAKATQLNGVNFIAEKIDLDMAGIRELSFSLKKSLDNLFLVFASTTGDKANLSVMISESLVKEKNMNAVNIIKELAQEIKGGGGGQPFFATAGGKNINGLDKALEKAKVMAERI